MRDKGSGNDFGGLSATADENLEFRARRCMVRRHKAERNGAAQRGRKATRGDLADHRARGIGDLGPLARRGAFDGEADADAAGLVGEFAEDTRGAGEIGGLAAALRDGEVKPGLDRRNALVEVVAVERQAGLKTEAVAGAEADGLDPLVDQQRIE